jgi:lysophospholipid acyltransferase (LPLAT)-like uncharacterized protein
MPESENQEKAGLMNMLLWRAAPAMMEYGAAPLCRLLGSSWQISVHNLKHFHSLPPSPTLFATWHGSLAGFVHVMRSRAMCALVSPVLEGELIARWLKGYGYTLVRGSSGHEAAEGLRRSVRVLRDGHNLGTAVDGPMGPARIVKPGVIATARLSGAPILPALTAASSAFTFPNWDRHELPLPTSRVLFGFGEPVFVPKRADEMKMEHCRILLENRLLDLDRELRSMLDTDGSGDPISLLEQRWPRGSTFWYSEGERK